MSTYSTADTIAAIATPPGIGGVGIVRVSGSLSRKIGNAITGKKLRVRYAHFLPFYAQDLTVIDSGIALFFKAPHSFTGEDILELQGHGGPMVLDMLLQQAIGMGARPAQPGEFSLRAFLNGKVDLLQAEAIADLIASSSHQAARSALRSLQGEFSAQINKLLEELVRLRMYVESAIDFPEEEIDFLSNSGIGERIEVLLSRIDAIRVAAVQGVLLREGMNIVIAGQPNAGKSSLLNRLAGRDTAIVTDIPGTTRDVLREQINIDGLPLHIIDTAGLRDTADPVEKEGIARAWAEIRQADRVLIIMDDRLSLDVAVKPILSALPPGTPHTIVRNKIDLTTRPPGLKNGESGTEIALSASSGIGIDQLRMHLKETVGYKGGAEGNFMARRRHIDALDRGLISIERAREHFMARQGELLAEELRLTQQALAEITGEFTSDDLLGRIFSTFCIGK